jgi:hypothetical protein
MKEARAMQTRVEHVWLDGLTVVLGLSYAVMGLAVGGFSGRLGILGGILIVAALVVGRRAAWLGMALLALGAVPFAMSTWWSLVTPLTALLALLLGGIVIARERQGKRHHAAQRA